MTQSLTGEPIAVDTNVIGWLFSRKPERLPYEPYVTGRQLVISFMTVAELRFGAEVAGWGQARRDRLAELLRSMVVVVPDDDPVNAYTTLRARCQRIGHGLHAKDHEADRWVAATAMRYDLQLVSDDKIFDNVPGLVNIRVPVS